MAFYILLCFFPAYAGISHPCPAEFYSPTRAAFTGGQVQSQPINNSNKTPPDHSKPIKAWNGDNHDNINCNNSTNSEQDMPLQNGVSFSQTDGIDSQTKDSEKENSLDGISQLEIIDLTSQSEDKGLLNDEDTHSVKQRRNIKKDLSLNLSNTRGQQRMPLHKRSPSLPMFINSPSSSQSVTSRSSPIATSPGDSSQQELFGSPPTYAMVRHFAQSPLREMRHVPISDDPYMSPYLAPDALLQGLPPVHMVVSNTSLTVFNLIVGRSAYVNLLFTTSAKRSSSGQ